ncbi:hypothetical protein [Flavihumibacter solisilvae]|uniref:Uncharacterized protein n=1 Tax=Flavihumibacter solisilvae TaxID=1349421 RepID=A0A0C1LFV5_9BACT|nr:hypothetical protein [Flavihumibacter solisilvae]KIC94233.1 hypothetical protein OI18_12715 [Flavihumibacter solisilvae]
MEKLHLVSAGLLAFLLISCDQGLPDENSYSTSPAATSTSAAAAANSAPAPAIAPLPSPASASVPVINPAHGQPGHRCNIPVGGLIPNAAPNNTPNAANNSSTVVLPPVRAPRIAGFANAANASNRNPATPSLFPTRSSGQLPSIATPQTIQTNALNPAHGKPGHRCDIAVGAPLNSAARAASAVPSAPASTIAAPTAPAISIPAQPVAVAPAVNPSHGQPGHRCDLPVGSPLNSKP